MSYIRRFITWWHAIHCYQGFHVVERTFGGDYCRHCDWPYQTPNRRAFVK